MKRRSFIQLLLVATSMTALMGKAALSFAADAIKQITMTDDEWRAYLTPAQYNVLRHEGTEPPFSSPLVDEHRKGVFLCAGCDLELFSSDKKFDSGTGWPSFFEAVPDRLGTKLDTKLLMMPREEYHCLRCGGHHGHVFKDGPKPTGLRYCNNGVALKFIPQA